MEDVFKIFAIRFFVKVLCCPASTTSQNCVQKEYGVISLAQRRYVFLVETYQYITYLDLVAKCEVFSRELFYVTNFWKIKISLGDF